MYERRLAEKKKLVKRRKSIDEAMGYQPIKAVQLDFGTQKKKYTMEDNYRAFKLFSIMDVNRDGRISIEEVNRMLMGDVPTTFLIRFEHPDTGIVWGFDEDNFVIIDKIEANSPASLVLQLIHGLRLVRVNHIDIENNRSQMNVLYDILNHPRSTSMEFEFIEPVLILTPFSNVLDIQIEGKIYSVELPVGAVYDLDQFKYTIRESMIKVNKIFYDVNVEVIGAKRQIHFQSANHTFRLLFATGPNYHRSCRFAIGFSAQDYPNSNNHTGQTMAINLDLGLTEEQLDTLTNELFHSFDKDSSGQLDFEEFRDFYVRFFDNEKNIEMLKAYAKYRYRDKELEAWYFRITEEKRSRINRKQYARLRDAEIIKQQRQQFLEDSELGNDGIRRRKKRLDKIIENIPDSKEQSDGSKDLDEINSILSVLSHNEESSDDSARGLGYDETSISRHNGEIAIESSKEREDTRGPKSEPLSASSSSSRALGNELTLLALENSQKLASDRDLTQEIDQIKAMKLRDNEIMHRQASARRKKEHQHKILGRKRPRANKEDIVPKEYLTEVELALRMSYEKAFQVKETSTEGMKQFNIDFSSTIASPALHMDAILFEIASTKDNIDLQEKSSPENMHKEYHSPTHRSPKRFRTKYIPQSNPLQNIKLDVLPPTKLHPATTNYFMVNDREIAPMFDSTARHPAYFNADYIRGNVDDKRHISNSMAICKMIQEDKAIGEEYRRKHGLYRVTALPSDEIYLTKKAVSWLEEQRLQRERLDHRVKDLSTAARLTINSIILKAVPRIHFLAANSPFIVISSRQVGQMSFKHRSSTEIIHQAGSRADWDELHWKFPLSWTDELIIQVFSTSNRLTDAKLVASMVFPAKDITTWSMSQDGDVKMSLDLSRRNSSRTVQSAINAGELILIGCVELGDEWDWHMNEYKRLQDRLSQSNKLERLTQRHKSHNMSHHQLISELVYPMELETSNITITDLKYPSLAFWSKKKPPSIEFQMNTWTKAIQAGDRLNRWENLHLRVLFMTSKDALQINIYNGERSVNTQDNLLGYARVSAEDLRTLSKDSDGLCQINGTILRKNQEIGRIVLTSRITHIPRHIAEREVQLNHVIDEKERVFSESMGSLISQISSDNAIVQWNDDISIHSGGLTVENLESLTQQGSLESLKDEQLSEVITNYEESSLNLMTGDALVIRDNQRYRELYDDLKTVNSQIEAKDQSSSSQTKKSLIGEISSDVPPHKADSEQAPEDVIEDMIEGKQVIDPPSGEQANDESYAMMQHINTIKNMDPNDFRPCRICSMAVSNLVSAYRLKRNCPRIHITVGDISEHTLPQMNKSKAVIFDDLNWTFDINGNTSMELTVWSEEVFLGACSLRLKDLLQESSDSLGIFHITIDLMRDKVYTGRLMIRYTFPVKTIPKLGPISPRNLPIAISSKAIDQLERSVDGDKFTSKFASITPSQLTLSSTLRPPFIATIHAIYLSNLASVHKFSSNSPYIKSACGLWRYNTNPSSNSKESVWEDISWTVIMDEDTEPSTNTIRISVLSSYTVIGHVVLSIPVILTAPINSSGLSEIHSHITLDDNETIRGDITIKLHLDHYHAEDDETRSDHQVGKRLTYINRLKGIAFPIVSQLHADERTDGDEAGCEPIPYKYPEINSESQESVSLMPSVPNDLNDVFWVKDWKIKIKSIFISEISELTPLKERNKTSKQESVSYVRLDYRELSVSTATKCLHQRACSWDGLQDTWKPFIVTSWSPFRVVVVSDAHHIGGSSISLDDILAARDFIKHETDGANGVNILLQSTVNTNILQHGHIAGKLTITVEAQAMRKSIYSNDDDDDDEALQQWPNIDLSKYDHLIKDMDGRIPSSKSSKGSKFFDLPTPSPTKNLKSALKSTNNIRKRSTVSVKSKVSIDESNIMSQAINSHLDDSKSQNSNQYIDSMDIDHDDIDALSEGAESEVTNEEQVIEMHHEHFRPRSTSLASFAVNISSIVQSGEPIRKDLEATILSHDALEKIRVVEEINSTEAFLARPCIIPTISHDKISPIDIATITNISCRDLIAVHKAGKNSPLVRISSDRWKQVTKAISFSGDHASWNSLNWSLPLVRMSTINITVSSSSTIIGTAKLDIQTISDLPTNLSAIDQSGLFFLELNLTPSSSYKNRLLANRLEDKISIDSAGIIRLSFDFHSSRKPTHMKEIIETFNVRNPDVVIFKESNLDALFDLATSDENRSIVTEASLDTIASPVNSKALKVNIPKIVTDFVSPRKSALRTPNQMSPLSSTQSARRVSFVGVVDKPPGSRPLSRRVKSQSITMKDRQVNDEKVNIDEDTNTRPMKRPVITALDLSSILNRLRRTPSSRYKGDESDRGSNQPTASTAFASTVRSTPMNDQYLSTMRSEDIEFLLRTSRTPTSDYASSFSSSRAASEMHTPYSQSYLSTTASPTNRSYATRYTGDTSSYHTTMRTDATETEYTSLGTSRTTTTAATRTSVRTGTSTGTTTATTTQRSARRTESYVSEDYTDDSKYSPTSSNPSYVTYGSSRSTSDYQSSDGSSRTASNQSTTRSYTTYGSESSYSDSYSESTYQQTESEYSQSEFTSRTEESAARTATSYGSDTDRSYSIDSDSYRSTERSSYLTTARSSDRETSIAQDTPNYSTYSTNRTGDSRDRSFPITERSISLPTDYDLTRRTDDSSDASYLSTNRTIGNHITQRTEESFISSDSYASTNVSRVSSHWSNKNDETYRSDAQSYLTTERTDESDVLESRRSSYRASRATTYRSDSTMADKINSPSKSSDVYDTETEYSHTDGLTRRSDIASYPSTYRSEVTSDFKSHPETPISKGDGSSYSPSRESNTEISSNDGITPRTFTGTPRSTSTSVALTIEASSVSSSADEDSNSSRRSPSTYRSIETNSEESGGVSATTSVISSPGSDRTSDQASPSMMRDISISTSILMDSPFTIGSDMSRYFKHDDRSDASYSRGTSPRSPVESSRSVSSKTPISSEYSNGSSYDDDSQSEATRDDYDEPQSSRSPSRKLREDKSKQMKQRRAEAIKLLQCDDNASINSQAIAKNPRHESIVVVTEQGDQIKTYSPSKNKSLGDDNMLDAKSDCSSDHDSNKESSPGLKVATERLTFDRYIIPKHPHQSRSHDDNEIYSETESGDVIRKRSSSVAKKRMMSMNDEDEEDYEDINETPIPEMKLIFDSYITKQDKETEYDIHMKNKKPIKRYASIISKLSNAMRDSLLKSKGHTDLGLLPEDGDKMDEDQDELSSKYQSIFEGSDDDNEEFDDNQEMIERHPVWISAERLSFDTSQDIISSPTSRRKSKSPSFKGKYYTSKYQDEEMYGSLYSTMIQYVAKTTVNRLIADAFKSHGSTEKDDLKRIQGINQGFGMVSTISDVSPMLEEHRLYLKSSGNELTSKEIISEVAIMQVKQYLWTGCQLIARRMEESKTKPLPIRPRASFVKAKQSEAPSTRRNGLIAKTAPANTSNRVMNKAMAIDMNSRDKFRSLSTETAEDMEYSYRYKERRHHFELQQKYQGNHAMILEEVRKGLYIPQQMRVTIRSINQINIARGIDLSLLPRRPYITACKPYSNWSAELPVAKGQSTNTLEWSDLSGKYHWESFVLKQSQCIVLDIRDQSSGGLIAARCKLKFEDIFKPFDLSDNYVIERADRGIATYNKTGEMINEHGFATIPIKFEVMKEYLTEYSLDHKTDINDLCGRYIQGYLTISMDYTEDIYESPSRRPEYWDKIRAQHWRCYPTTPIATGVVRHKYLEISQEYDRQMIINPVFFGFTVRWQANPSDESRFKNPIFWGYSLNKGAKPTTTLTTVTKIANNKENDSKLKFVIDPYEKLQSRCPVCREGVDGCPRCYTIPTSETDNGLILDLFAFNPLKDRMAKEEMNQKEIETKVKSLQRERGFDLSANNSIADDRSVSTHTTNIDSEGNASDENDKYNIHTKLTTFPAIRLYRNLMIELVTVYIKVMPTGSVHKVIVDPRRDSVYHLYHMFHSCCVHGSHPKSPMLILPTSSGFYELTNTMSHGTNMLLSDFSGRMLLSEYGFRGHRHKIILLYFMNYQANYIRSMITSYLEHNITIKKSHEINFKSTNSNQEFNIKDIPIHTTLQTINKDPNQWYQDDIIQKSLLAIARVQYTRQRDEVVHYYAELGKEYRNRIKVQENEEMKAKLMIKERLEREYKTAMKKIQAQITGLSHRKERLDQFSCNHTREILSHNDVLRIERLKDKYLNNSYILTQKMAAFKSNRLYAKDLTNEEVEAFSKELAIIGVGPSVHDDTSSLYLSELDSMHNTRSDCSPISSQSSSISSITFRSRSDSTISSLSISSFDSSSSSSSSTPFQHRQRDVDEFTFSESDSSRSQAVRSESTSKYLQLVDLQVLSPSSQAMQLNREVDSPSDDTIKAKEPKQSLIRERFSLSYFPSESSQNSSVIDSMVSSVASSKKSSDRSNSINSDIFLPIGQKQRKRSNDPKQSPKRQTFTLETFSFAPTATTQLASLAANLLSFKKKLYRKKHRNSTTILRYDMNRKQSDHLLDKRHLSGISESALSDEESDPSDQSNNKPKERILQPIKQASTAKIDGNEEEKEERSIVSSYSYISSDSSSNQMSHATDNSPDHSTYTRGSSRSSFESSKSCDEDSSRSLTHSSASASSSDASRASMRYSDKYSSSRSPNTPRRSSDESKSMSERSMSSQSSDNSRNSKDKARQLILPPISRDGSQSSGFSSDHSARISAGSTSKSSHSLELDDNSAKSSPFSISSFSSRHSGSSSSYSGKSLIHDTPTMKSRTDADAQEAIDTSLMTSLRPGYAIKGQNSLNSLGSLAKPSIGVVSSDLPLSDLKTKDNHRASLMDLNMSYIISLGSQPKKPVDPIDHATQIKPLQGIRSGNMSLSSTLSSPSSTLSSPIVSPDSLIHSLSYNQSQGRGSLMASTASQVLGQNKPNPSKTSGSSQSEASRLASSNPTGALDSQSNSKSSLIESKRPGNVSEGPSANRSVAGGDRVKDFERNSSLSPSLDPLKLVQTSIGSSGSLSSHGRSLSVSSNPRNGANDNKVRAMSLSASSSSSSLSSRIASSKSPMFTTIRDSKTITKGSSSVILEDESIYSSNISAQSHLSAIPEGTEYSRSYSQSSRGSSADSYSSRNSSNSSQSRT